MPRFYLTTPIYYVNAAPHIGHAYTTIVADTIKRIRQMLGDDAYLTTGSDEHGLKVEQSARKAGLEPKAFTDRVSEAFRTEWEELGLEVDFYRRTTDPRHAKAVHAIFERCLANGAIYKGSFTGKYHVGDEAFVTDEEADAADPEMIVTLTEENYFFRLSAYQDRLLELFESQPDFVQPESRRNEMMAFIRGGLKDLSISRSALKWGIPLPNDPAHVFYVWFDALTTYMSAIGYGEDDGPDSQYARLWPVDMHLVGKEIVRFHSVYWPAFLMAAELPLPRQVWAHGWLIFQGGKMSKTKGNIVRALPIKQVVGVDGLRYYLLREIVFGQDGNFSQEALAERYNADLANGIGNIASRTVSMLHRYCKGRIPSHGGDDGGLPSLAEQCVAAAIEHYRRYAFSRALESVWTLLARVDKYIVEHKPWALVKSKDSGARQQLETTLYCAVESLRIASVLLAPVIPDGAQKVWNVLGLEGAVRDQRLDGVSWGGLKPGHSVGRQVSIYPRLDVKQAVERMAALEEEALAEQAAMMGAAKPGPPPITIEEPEIQIDDFFRVDMRVGIVTKAAPVPKSSKLLELEVDIGEASPRTVLAGIAEAYKAEDLVGRRVAVVANLKPRKMMGRTSQGMIVAAALDRGEPFLAGFSDDTPIGARLG